MILKFINSLVDSLSKVLAYFAGALILAIAAVQLLEIGSRNLFGISLSWVWEYAPFFHMCAVFLAAAFTLRTGGHIRVTAIMQLQPRAFEFLGTSVALLISAFVSYSLIWFAIDFSVTGRSSGTTTETPLVYPAATMAVGSFLLTVQLLLRLIQTLLRLPEEVEWGQQLVAAD
jgi:TRAP-type C4-dicarboxylate transport system permease small subunit